VGSLFVPLFGLAGSATRSPRGGRHPVPRRELLRLLEGQRQESQRVKLQKMQAEETLARIPVAPARELSTADALETQVARWSCASRQLVAHRSD